jgi:hypothetical protein
MLKVENSKGSADYTDYTDYKNKLKELATDPASLKLRRTSPHRPTQTF